jgi:O-antigen/teichoic acid export membrane protein
LMIPVAALAPLAFSILFGQEWRQAGHLVQALVFFLMVRFVSSPLSYVWIIRGKQSIDMWWQAGLVAVTALAFVGTNLLWPGIGLFGTLLVYSVLGGGWYGLCIFLSYRFSR